MIARDVGILIAYHWWAYEAGARERPEERHVVGLLKFLFDTLDALWAIARTLPENLAPPAQEGMVMAGVENVMVDIPVAPNAWAAVRSAISLSGDAFCIAKRLEGTSVPTLRDAVRELLTELTAQRDFRNFLAHLDERMTDLETHGITGDAETRVGLRYEGARACFHLIVRSNEVSFSSRGRVCSVGIGKADFGRLLAAARPLYRLLCSHRIHAANYPPAEELYAL